MAISDLSLRYANAEAMLPHRMKHLVIDADVRPHWIRETETFWHLKKTAEGKQFIHVDAEAAVQRPAFDHAKLSSALSELFSRPYEAQDLPFDTIELTDDVVRVVVDERRIEVTLDGYVATIVELFDDAESYSPDGRWAARVHDRNLYLRDTRSQEVRQLTTDGTVDYGYAVAPDTTAELVFHENLGITPRPLLVWSPDSSRFVTYRLDQREVELMHLVRSMPLDGRRPALMSYRYAMVGDEHLATADFFIFDAESGTAVQAKTEPVLMEYLSPITRDQVWWGRDATKAYWLASDRGGLRVRLEEMDPITGTVTTVVEETGDTHLMHGPQFYDRNVRALDSGDVLWWSERSGWGHLYLYLKDGSIRTLTSGDWLVRSVVSVDEQSRRILFTAAGRKPGSDLYMQELCSVSLDGGEVVAVTSDGLDHDPRPSRSGRFFVDSTSRVDVPTVCLLRDAAGQVVMEIGAADAGALYAAGWTPPERTVVKSADGLTDIYCAIYKPHDFDPLRTYPVLDEIYPGPQVSTAPLRFPSSGGAMTAERSGAAFAALGFVVVAVDARGTAMRERAFQDHLRLGGRDDFVDDHVAAIRQLSATRPWMDLDRVGIFGHSGGGYASTRSLLHAPEFFKVAVSSAGDHDDRFYHSWWGERFYGMSEHFDFDRHANAPLVENLRGKLLLAHGSMDDNVTPHLTMRLVDALIRANKDFDLLIVPNADHSMHHHQAYWLRRRWDYFVEHLMGQTPPDYRIKDIPIDPQRLGR